MVLWTLRNLTYNVSISHNVVLYVALPILSNINHIQKGMLNCFIFIWKKKKEKSQYSLPFFYSIILWREMYFLVYICESNIKLGEWQMTVLAHTLVLYKINPYLELRVSREILWSWCIVLMYTYKSISLEFTSRI